MWNLIGSLHLLTVGIQAAPAVLLPRTAAFLSTAAPEEPPPALGTAYSSMTVGVPKETFDLERRVSTTPESATKLVDAGFNVQVRKVGSVGFET